MSAAASIAGIVVSRSRPEILRATLDAILAQEPPPDRLILVDNDATEAVRGVIAEVTSVHDAIDVVQLDHNSGAAGGFHAGLEAALRSGVEMACCFDDDARPEPGCLQALQDAIAALPNAGAVGAAAHDGTGRLSWPLYVEGSDRPPLRTLDEARRAAAQQGGFLPVAGLCWHGLLIRLDAVRRHGNVWAELFLQYEDAELALRLRRAGLPVYAVPAAECIHPLAPPSRSWQILGRELWIRVETPTKAYLTTRNDLVVRHRYGGSRFWIATGPLIIVRGFLTSLVLGIPRVAALRHVFLRALVDAARMRLGPPPPATMALARSQRRERRELEVKER
jgi:rhamnopyranosyl-N-acetylglucosaminyl-diphospho-decaprenol beta-1,3/1,4-galactofuranosyltransferase